MAIWRNRGRIAIKVLRVNLFRFIEEPLIEAISFSLIAERRNVEVKTTKSVVLSLNLSLSHVRVIMSQKPTLISKHIWHKRTCLTLISWHTKERGVGCQNVTRGAYSGIIDRDLNSIRY